MLVVPSCSRAIIREVFNQPLFPSWKTSQVRGRNVWITSMSALCVIHSRNIADTPGRRSAELRRRRCLEPLAKSAPPRAASSNSVSRSSAYLQRISQDQERCPCSRLLQLSLWLMTVSVIYNVISSTRAILEPLCEITSEMSSQSVRRSSTVRVPSLPIFELNKNFAQCLQNVSMISRYRTWSVSMVRTPWNATSRLSSKMWLLSRVRVSSERRQKSVAHVT